ncbi:MAG: response regulator [SAR324 cluster bacterium]|nr:response regulator [SAR324 cluster bacterium]
MSNDHVLVVEDEVFIAVGLQKKLENFGYIVTDIATTGEEAIEKAISTRPDLILMDIVLNGEMDGITAAKRIWDQFKIPIIYLSAYSDEKNLKRAKTTSPYGYLLKPFNDRELQIAIEIALYKKSLEKKILERERWYSAILKSLGEAVITVGMNFSILYLNSEAEKIFGVKRSDIVGRSLSDLGTINQNKEPIELVDMVKSIINHNSPIRKSYLQYQRNNESYILDLCITSIQNEDNLTMGAALIFSDKTNQASMSVELVSKEADLAKAQNMVLQLLTLRERQVLQQIVDGQTTKEIAVNLDISPRTVEFHRYNLMRKLNVQDIPSLVRHAIIKQMVTTKQS